MRLFGLEIRRAKRAKAMSPVPTGGGGWLPLIREPFAGAWQRGIVEHHPAVMAHHAVFACTTLIASDIAKLRVKVVRQDAEDGVWSEITSPAYSPVLRRPNPIQNRIQFWESWILSKLLRGNTYVLKRRDGRNVVNALYVLDPNRVRPLVSDSGAVFYELQTDNISGLPSAITVPAREIIHDRWNCLFHPLVGMSPIYASGLAATQGLRIQESAIRLFENDSRPGGILTAPGRINDDTAKRLKEYWEQNYSGANRGRVAVLGDGLKYERMAVTATEAQLIDQLKWSAEVVCSTFHVPPYKVGIGAMPTYNNIQSLNVEYYSQCLQVLIEAAELCLDEGLEMPAGLGTEFDLDGLLRMDTVTQINALKEGVLAAIYSPNEARRKLDLPPKKGGDTPYLQQQNWSLEALAARPVGATDPLTSTPPAARQDDEPDADEARAALVEIYKGLAA